MRTRIFVSGIAVVVIAAISLTASFAANRPIDATLSTALPTYKPTPADLANASVTAGDTAAAIVYSVGTALQYTGLVLDGDGVNPDGAHPFLKVQQQNGSGSFEYGACYLGNNGSAGVFGLGFFALSQPFKSAVMRALRMGSNVAVQFTHVNGGALPDQTYICLGAPSPVGASIGVVGYANSTARLDNFRGCSSALDNFEYVGSLGSTGNWNDAAPGMNSNGHQAVGGSLALSFWLGSTGCGTN